MYEFKNSISEGNNGKAHVTIEDGQSTGMVREFKGTSANKHVDDYCVVDLETTGVFVNLADIIEISALKVRANQVVDEFSTLVNPQCPIPADATAVNHITDDMVKDAPILEDVIDAFLAFVGEDVILGYNNAGFDMNLIYDSVQELRDKAFSNNYLDMLHAVRRSLPILENSKLETASKHYGLDTAGEHRALKDCYLTKAVYEKLFEEFGDTAFKKRSHHASGNGMQYSAETMALQEMSKLLEGMLKDNQIVMDEIDELRAWLEEHRDLAGNYPFDKAFNSLDNVLEDGQITEQELADLRNIFEEIVDPVKAQGCRDEISTLEGKHIVLTGEFDCGERSAVAKQIEEVGGINDKGVTKKTDYVVVGAQGSDAWKTGKYGGKIQKSMELNAKGRNIKIIEEKEFIPMLRYLLEHLEKCGCEDGVEGDSGSDDWQAPIQTMLDAMVVEHELPEQSLYLKANYGRDGKKITSYSVCIYEPDYPMSKGTKKDPTQNSIVLNLKDGKDTLELMIDETAYGDIGPMDRAEEECTKSNKFNVCLLIAKDAASLVPYIKKATEYALANYTSKAQSFGCCSLFNACSDARKCIHENKLHSKACYYRSHLDAGRIFYGKNRNVD